jgi:nicotinamide-nucleotide amidase
MFSNELLEKARRVLDGFRGAGLRAATAESCTGGLIAACLTEIAGSSDVVDRGFVTYSNEAKTEMLGVPEEMLKAHGAVSPEVARSMAEGAIAHSRADVAVSVTGIAGPGGGSADKPVGLVYFGLARRGGETKVERHVLGGDRAEIRMATVDRALSMLAEALGAGEVAEAAGATADDFMNRLAKAVEGLLFPSESDVPLTPLRFGGSAEGELSPETLRQTLGQASEAPVETLSVDELFAPVIEAPEGKPTAEAQKYRELLELLKRELSDLKAFRVGKVDIHVYVLGRHASGQWLGLKTRVVET